MNTLKKTFKFKLIEKFPGYNSAFDKTKLDPGFLIRGSKNVYLKKTGTLASRFGIKTRGSTDNTDAGVKASCEWHTNVGTTRNIRVCNGKLQVESDIVTTGTFVWYDLLETGTLANPAVTYTRFVFDTWWDNDEKTDRLIMARGDTYIPHWSGGMALVSSVTATTITKQGSESWAELGFATQISGEKKIVINSIEFSYTGGESTTTLTGVTGDTSSLTSGMVAIQSIILGTTDTSGFNFDFLKTVDNQVWCGSYSSRVVYKSADITAGGTLGFLNLIDSNDIVYGDPDSIVLDDQCRGIGVHEGKIILFAGESNMTIITPNQNVTFSFKYDATNTRFNFQKVESKRLPGLMSALGHEFIDNLGEYLVWVDQRNQLRALGTFANVDTIKPVHLSLAVEQELFEDDFTGGHLRVIADAVHITSPNNGRDWMYEIREQINGQGQAVSQKIWQPPQIRGISRFAVVDGLLHGHSNVNPMLYQIDDTGQYHDDGPTDGEPIPFTWVARFSYLQHGERDRMITFDKFLAEGYMPKGCEVNLNIYCDYQGASAIKNYSISNDTELCNFYIRSAPSLGDSSLGTNPLGDGIIGESNDQDIVPKFRSITDVFPGSFFEYSLELYSEIEDARCEFICIGTNPRESSQTPVHLRKRTTN